MLRLQRDDTYRKYDQSEQTANKLRIQLKESQEEYEKNVSVIKPQQEENKKLKQRLLETESVINIFKKIIGLKLNN